MSGNVRTYKASESWSPNSIHFSDTELYIADLSISILRLLNPRKRTWEGSSRTRLQSWKKIPLLLLPAFALFQALVWFPLLPLLPWGNSMARHPTGKTSPSWSWVRNDSAQNPQASVGTNSTHRVALNCEEEQEKASRMHSGNRTTPHHVRLQRYD